MVRAYRDLHPMLPGMSRPPAYPHAELTHEILGAFYAVYNGLGHGFREVVYQRALLIELECRGLSATREVPVTVTYRGSSVGTFRADLVVADTVLLELKALPRIEPSHVAQTLNALRATGLELGLLLNFGPQPSIKRLIATRKNMPSRNESV